MSDVRFAFRQLLKTPGFTATALITLALGIGACSAIFTVVNSVLLRPLAYPDSERLMVLRESFLPDYPIFSIAPGNFTEWAKQADAFESMYALRHGVSSLATDGEPVRVMSARVTGRFFETLGVQPALGRGFGPAEDFPGKNDVAVLTHAFWQRQFGGRPDIVNSTIRLNGRTVTVLGVMPPWFERGGAYELYTPAGWTPEQASNRGPHHLAFVVGRLKHGVSVSQARAQMDAIATRLGQQYPDTNKNWGVQVLPMLDAQTGNVRTTFYTLLGAVAALLMIACTNIANLLLVRASARQHETSVRAALGASHFQLLKHFLMENLMLSLAGGLLGLLAARWGLDALLALAPTDLPRVQEIGLDARAVAVTTGLTLLTGIGFGLVPFWLSTQTNLVDTLKGAARIVGDSATRRIFRQGLVVAEIALALMLLAGAGLLIRSFARLSHANPGFKTDHALMVWVMTPEEKYNSPDKQTAFAEAVTERFRALPGVTAVGATPFLPFATSTYVALLVETDGRQVPMNERPGTAAYAVTADYLSAMGIPLLRGRGITDQDRNAAIAVVSQSFANRIFSGQDPIGKRINVRGGPNNWWEIVGVVADIKHDGFDAAVMPQLYMPLAQRPHASLSVVIRTEGDPATLGAAVRRELAVVDPDQPVYRIEKLDALVATNIARQRFAMILIGVFAGIALLLATVGVYGVMAYTVELRGAELSLRAALGAQAADLRRIVLNGAARVIIPGLVLGISGALAGARLIQSLLYETSAGDPVVLLAAGALLTAIALLACWLPARRATRMNAINALRAE